MAAQPTLKQLKYLCAVAKSRHFGQAANACHVTQSTLSAAITELEEHLGSVLLERSHKGVMLTAAGEEVVTRSQAILTKVDDLINLCQASEKLLSNPLRLGIIPTIAPFLLLGLLNHLRTAYPAFKLLLREDLSKPLLERLYDGELDLLLLALPFPAQGAETRHLFYDNFLLACPESHPYANKQTILLNDLRRQELLLLEDGHCLRDHALEACKLEQSDLSIPYQATSLNTLIQMVANGLGITLLPQMAVDAHILDGIPVSYRPFNEKDIHRSIGLMWRKTSPRKKEFELLGDILCQLQKRLR